MGRDVSVMARLVSFRAALRVAAAGDRLTEPSVATILAASASHEGETNQHRT